MVTDGDGFWAGRSVLITGAAGLLGRWVAHSLASVGAKVVGLDLSWGLTTSVAGRRGIDQVEGDIREPHLLDSLLRGREISTVIHLAAQTIVGPADEDPGPTFDVNIRGTWILLEACRHLPGIGSVVVASSDKAYGDAGGRPYEEDMPLRARHPYAASKAGADLIAQTYAVSYGMPVVVTRCGNIYGGGDLHWSRIVPGTIRSVVEGSRPVIRSDGTYVRDYLYAGDAASGVVTLAQAAVQRPDLRGQAFNFGADERISVSEMVTAILGVMGSDLQPRILNQARNEIPEQRVSSAKAREVLGWMPSSTLEQGLYRTVAWYREHLRAAS